MDVFIVSKACMDRCVAAICASHRHGSIILLFDGLNTGAVGSPTEIGRRLYAMNQDSVNERYPDFIGMPSLMPGPPDVARLVTNYVFEPPVEFPRTANLIAYVRSLDCLSYQCSVGNVPDSPLFAELQRACMLIALHIVSQLPGYEAGIWG